MSNQSQKLPIGYWLRKADEGLTRATNRALEGRGLTRFQWQLLNLVSEADVITRAHASETLQTFVDEDQIEVMVNEFIQKGWMAQRLDGTGEVLVSLTEAGQAAHAEILKVQTGVRRRSMDGISEQEYETVLRVLQKVVTNLDSGSP